MICFESFKIKAIECIGRVEWSENVQVITKVLQTFFERHEEIHPHQSDDIEKLNVHNANA
jgi:hypothetical protein